jgi:hypothetical protein
LLVVVRDYQNRLFVPSAQEAEAELLLHFSTHAHESLPQQDKEVEDDDDEDMMAPLGFALSGVAATTTTTPPPPPPPPPPTTAALAFRPAPGAEEDRIE